MGNTPTAEYLIAALAAMVVVVTFRRKTPKALEIAVWVSLVWVCVVAITNTRNPQARALTSAGVWGASRIVSMIVGVSAQDVLRWMVAARFAIASWVVVVFAVDAFVLALVSSKRQGDAQMPVTRLGEWWVLPRLRPIQPELAVASGVDEINQRLNVRAAAAVAATVTWSTLAFIWLRDVEIPTAARGLKQFALGAGVAWQRVAVRRSQVGEVRISSIADASTNTSPTADRLKGRVAAESAPLGVDIVDINLLVERVEAREAQVGTAARRSRRRNAPLSPQPDARTDKNGSEQRDRPGRLAS